MKKTIAIVALVLCIFCAATAHAEDALMNGKISKVTVAKDKNGNEYVRLSVESPRSISGVHYNALMTVMAFGDSVDKAKAMKAGDAFRAVVAIKSYQGRESATILGYPE